MPRPLISQHVPQSQRTKLDEKQPVVLSDLLASQHGAGEHGSLFPTILLRDEDVLCIEACIFHNIPKIFQGLRVDVRVST